MKKRFSLNKRIIAGWIIGIIIPLACIPLVISLLSWADSTRTFNILWDEFTGSTIKQSKIVSLAVIANLGVFYFFLNRERYDLAKGVIIGSACFLPFILYANFA